MAWIQWQKPTRGTHGWGVEIDIGLGELRGIKISASGNNAGEIADDFLAGVDVPAMKQRAHEAGKLSPEVLGLVRQSPAFLHGRRPRPEVENGRAREAHDKTMLELDSIARQRGLSAAEFVANLYDVSTQTAYRWLLDARREHADRPAARP